MRRDVEFGEYVGARRARLYRTAYLVCGDPHLAEDVVQNALARLYAAWPRVRRMDDVDAYARRSVVNAAADEGRRPWRRDQSVDPAGGGILDRPARAGLAHEDSDALFAALRALPAGQRRVVVLRHYWGLSVEETAADLGISPGTVKSQTSDALAALRRALDDTTIGGSR
jgi:RNA polymerase sigma-70 factor (sigma-E family)